jgi:3-isopropylmalate/(R)-2-methylmalate dehydratase large subunit
LSHHYVPGVAAESAAILQLTRQWAADQSIEHFHDMEGICHVVLPERAHLRPAMFVVGDDSQTNRLVTPLTAGAAQRTRSVY